LARVKIYELAKEISVESKDILRKLQKMGVNAKNHMSTISEREAEEIRQNFAAAGKGKISAAAPGGFVPRVTRIPKAVIAKEQADTEAGSPVQPAAPAEPASAAAVPAQPAPAAEVPRPAAAAAEAPAPPPAPPTEQEIKAAASEPAAAPQPTPAAQAAPGRDRSDARPVEQNRDRGPREHGRPQQQGGGQGRPAQQGWSKDRPQQPGGGQGRPAQQGGGQGRPAQQGWNKDRPQQPGGGQGRPAQPGGGQGRPAQPGWNKDRPQQPGGSQGRPAQQGWNKDRPQQPGAGKDRPAQPGGGKGRPPQAGAKAAAPEKPTTNYRPSKKVFVKDIVAEKSYEAEVKGKGFRPPGKGYKGNKSLRNEKMAMPPVMPRKITIGETVILGELAKTMGKTAGEIIKKLFAMGIMATINQELDAETAILLADEFGVTVEVKADRAAEIMEDIADDEGEMAERPPVVTIMGHVDHGKTSLLDAIRHTNVVSGEAGGITQHIGAYQVEIKGRKITFLDTPGHEAFTAMRARGAQMTDIAIIVVAADDGVMPQTVEAINHSKAAGVPVIIAINKIDKPGADVGRVKQELTEYGLVAEEWGGDTIMVEVSAKARINLEGLLEMILLVAEVGELKANADRAARGVVVEAKLDKNRGPVATLLVQKGTLQAGDNLLAGAVFGKVRAMHDDKGKKVKTAGPSMPVEVLGFAEAPPAGEIFMVVKDERDARLVAAKQGIKKREEELHKSSRVSLDDLFKQIEQGEIKELSLVVKADVQGSVEALTQSLVKLNTDEVKVNVIHAGVGGISESDVMLAAASNAIIIGFNIIAPPAARTAAEQEGVDIRIYRVIYDCIEDIKLAMSGLLAPKFKENIIGHVEVRQVIRVPKVGVVAGSYVTSGKIARNSLVRVIRNNVVIADDKVAGLKRFKDDAKEVLQGFECGISLESFNDLKEGDVFEVYVMEQIERQL